MKTEQEQQEILNELENFTGTEHYYKFSVLFEEVLTDGIQFLCNKLNCFWIMDIVGSVSHLKAIKENESFILWKIKLVGKGFIVRAYKDYESKETEEFNKKYLLYEQEGEYTDFALKDFEFYESNKVILLKSEY